MGFNACVYSPVDTLAGFKTHLAYEDSLIDFELGLIKPNSQC